jgi:hypothetical protein
VAIIAAIASPRDYQGIGAVVPQVTLEELLVVPGPGEPPEALQQYLQLLAEAYRRTHALAAKLQPIAGPSCNTSVRWHLACPQGYADFGPAMSSTLQHHYNNCMCIYKYIYIYIYILCSST